MGSFGVAVGSAPSGVSTRAVYGPLGAQSLLPDRCQSASFTWGEGPLFCLGRVASPLSVSSPLGPRITGAIPTVMSYFSAFVPGGGIPSLSRSPGGRGVSTPKRVRLHRRLFLQGSVQFLDAALDPEFH